jgi:hypothetical protein
MTRVEELMLEVAELSPSEKIEFLETVQREIEDRYYGAGTANLRGDCSRRGYYREINPRLTP